MLHEDDSQRLFLAQHSVATLFRMVTTLFQHCNAVLRENTSLRSVPCNIDGDEDDKNVKNVMGLIGKTTTLQVHHAFLYTSLPSLHHYDGKMPHFTFYGGRKQATAKSVFFLLLNLNLVFRNSAPKEFACI